MERPMTNDERTNFEQFLRDHPIDPAYDYVDDLLDVSYGVELEQQIARTAKYFLDEAASEQPLP